MVTELVWKCGNCKHQQREMVRPVCPNCGLVIAGLGTHQKYQILQEYCYPLSLIMRNQGFEHYFIDACAGSGIVQAHNSTELIDGSPIIMAKTREIVEERIKNKTKEPSVKCIFIEYNQKTYELLLKSVHHYSNFVECHIGDCNILLPKILDKIKAVSQPFIPFALVYVDPFGLGEPVISYKTIQQVLERDFTELFIHFSWEGVSRMAGKLGDIDHSDPSIRKVAQSTVKSLDLYLGNEWQEIQKQNLHPIKRRKMYVTLYGSMLREYYPNVEYIEIPVGSKNPSYYLFFTTRNDTGHKIMKGIMNNIRRKGTASLDKFMKGNLKF